MIEIPRRSFLFGMAATLASAASAKPALWFDHHVMMPAPLPFRTKRIFEFMMTLDGAAAKYTKFAVTVGDRKLLEGAMAPGSSYRWSAGPEPIIQRHGELLLIDMGGDLTEAMICSIIDDDVGIVETYKPGQPATFHLEAQHG